MDRYRNRRKRQPRTSRNVGLTTKGKLIYPQNGKFQHQSNILTVQWFSNAVALNAAMMKIKMQSRIWILFLATLPHSNANDTSSTTATTPVVNPAANVPVQSVLVPAEFPKAIFAAYYKEPSLKQQPQPILTDELNSVTYPDSLTDPLAVGKTPSNKVNFPNQWPNPEQKDPTTVFYQSIDTAASIINGSTGVAGNCSRCIEAIAVGQQVARLAPGNFSDALIRLCKTLQYKADGECETAYATTSPEPAVWAQVLQGADVRGNDGLLICHSMFGNAWCDRPNITTPNIDFGGEKPQNAVAPPPSGQRVKVLHLSDIHLDPRYAVGAETTDCAAIGCCRQDADNKGSVQNPAPLNGHPNCDTPFSLFVSALASVAPLTGGNGTTQDNIAWTIFTGDLMPRENSKYRNDNYLAYLRSSVFKILKYFLNKGPIYPVLGALDAFNEDPSLFHPLVGDMKASQDRSYQHMQKVFETNQWLSKEESSAVVPHRMGYTALHPQFPKLRIIALNTNFWSLQNYYNYVNSTATRESIILSDLIGWLLQAEKAQERVWIVGHIPPFATQTLPNLSDAFYQVVERFTPHVIASVFFGHLHADAVNVFYKNGGQDVTSEDNVLMTAWLGPSLSPKSGNPSYKVYEVDTGNFKIYESRTYFTNTSRLAPPRPGSTTTLSTALTSTSTATGPSETETSQSQPQDVNGTLWELGYDVRAAYGAAMDWPLSSALTAAFWHRLGTFMLRSNGTDNNTLAATYRMYSSTSMDGYGVTEPCDSACINSTVCRMRAAKESLWEQCGSGQTQSNSTSANVAQNPTTTSPSVQSTESPAQSKRDAAPELEVEIDVYLNPGGSTSDVADTDEQQDTQGSIEKRRVPAWWSKASAIARASGFLDGGVPEARRKGQVQRQGQMPKIQSPGQVETTQTSTITGTRTKTLDLGIGKAAPTTVAKRTAQTEYIDESNNDASLRKDGTDGESTADLGVRYADPEPLASADPLRIDPLNNPYLRPATTTLLSTKVGDSGVDDVKDMRDQEVSTGYQYLDMVISAESSKGKLEVYTKVDQYTTYGIPKKPRALTAMPGDESSDTTSTEIIDEPMSSNEGSFPLEEEDPEAGIIGEGFDDELQYASVNIANTAMLPADAPDTTTTTAFNEATSNLLAPEATGNPQRRDFPIYRPGDLGDDGEFRRSFTEGGDDAEETLLVEEVQHAKRTAAPEPEPKRNRLLDLWSKLEKVRTFSGQYKAQEETEILLPATDDPLFNFKKRTASLEPVSTAELPTPDDAEMAKRSAEPQPKTKAALTPSNALQSMWASKLSSKAAAESAQMTKRSADPQPKTKVALTPSNALQSMWASKLSSKAAAESSKAAEAAKKAATP